MLLDPHEVWMLNEGLDSHRHKDEHTVFNSLDTYHEMEKMNKMENKCFLSIDNY